MSKIPDSQTDALIVGGGFFGATIAAHLARAGDRVTLVERSGELLTRASYVNQARVHAGYHYPRSVMTALRSSANFQRFTEDYPECIDDSFTMIYAIARDSKVTASQFVKLCEGVGAPIRPARPHFRELFNDWLIEEVFETREYAFNADKLRRQVRSNLQRSGVEVVLGTRVAGVAPDAGGGLLVRADPDDQRWLARRVFSCAYAQTNTLLHDSGLPLLPLKNELAEISLLQVPEPLRDIGITIMDGPYFSVMPFPARGVHSIHHVRYSPHHYWHDLDEYRDAYAHLARAQARPNYRYMIADAARYVPSLADSRCVDSMFEIKTVLMQNEIDDGRPILFRTDYGIQGFSVLLGAKLDNIYDVLEAIDAEQPRRQRP